MALRKKALFNPASHATKTHEFIIGTMLAGTLAGIGFVLGGVVVRALIRKYSPPNSFLAIGLPP